MKLVAKIGGTNVDLIDSISGGTTYHCMAKVEVDAGSGGEEIVSICINPSMPSEPSSWDETVEVDFLSNEETLNYYAIGGTYATAGHHIYYDEFSMSSKFYSEAFGDEPVATFDLSRTGINMSSLSNITVSNYISSLIDSPEIYVCYGATQGDASISSWDYAELITDSPMIDTQYSKTLNPANLSSDLTYYCALVATNESGSSIQYLDTFLNGEITVTKARMLMKQD